MRTEYCGQLHVSVPREQQVTLCGWVNRRRDLGVDVCRYARPRRYYCRCSSSGWYARRVKLASELRNEFCAFGLRAPCVRVTRRRNADMATGEIEVLASLTIVNAGHCRLTLFHVNTEEGASQVPLSGFASSGNGAAPEKPAPKLLAGASF